MSPAPEAAADTGVTITTAHPQPVTSPDRSWPAVLAGTGALVSLVSVSISRFVPWANADALVHALISTDKLTVYYWGQDRLANVVPLLAWPVRDVSANFFAQMAIMASAYFLLIGSFAWFHVNRSAWRATSDAGGIIVVAGALAGAVSLALFTLFGGYDFVIQQPYALSLLLMLVGTYFVVGTRVRAQLAGAVLVLVATVLVPATVLLVPVAAVLRDGPGTTRRVARATAVAAVAFVAATVLSRVAFDGPVDSEQYAEFSWSAMRVGFRIAIENIGGSMNTKSTLTVGALSAVVLFVRRRSLLPSLRRAYLATPFVAIGWIALFSANRWVANSDFHHRYYFTAYACGLFVVTGAITELSGVAIDRLQRRGRPSPHTLRVATGGVLAVGAVILTGRALSTDVMAVDDAADDFEVAERFDAELVLGDYWQVWPIVFTARDHGNDIQPIVFRSVSIRDRIMDVVAAVPADGSIAMLCVGAELDSCLADLTAFTEEPWRVVSVEHDDPTVAVVARVG